MRIVIALGGNAILQRGQMLTAENQRLNVRKAVEQLSPLIDAGHQIVLTHGSGPQIGLLSLQNFAYKPNQMYPLDVLDAEVSGMIGYVIGQELYNARSDHPQIATLLTQIEVDWDDPAFETPSKPIGPFMQKAEAERLSAQYNWQIVEDKGQWRRAVASPFPRRVIEADIIRMMVKNGIIVICAGGGGVPVVRDQNGDLIGIEAVIDKDHASALVAKNVNADQLLLLTDVEGVYENWGADDQCLVAEMNPVDADASRYPAGSMGPKIAAASSFGKISGKSAVIGSINYIPEILAGKSGTHFKLN